MLMPGLRRSKNLVHKGHYNVCLQGGAPGVGSQTSWTVKWRVLSEVNADIELKGNGVEDVRLIALE